MINIRQDLILAELERDVNNGFIFSYQKLSNRFLDSLFNYYYVDEMCENYYDSEPDEIEHMDDEYFYMYMDYNFAQCNGRFPTTSEKFAEKNHTVDELRAAYFEVERIRQEYKSQQIEFCNWQEPFFKGNWGMTQEYVDKVSKLTLKDIRRTSVKKKGRLFVARQRDEIRIYWYGRDFMQVDYWWVFKKRNRRVK